MSTSPLIAFRADADLREKIEALAVAERGTMSDVLRKAVAEHLTRIAAADLDANPAQVSFLVGSIFGATATVAARSGGELADLAAAFRAAAGQDALSAEDRGALARAADFLGGSAAALRDLADRFRFIPENLKRPS